MGLLGQIGRLSPRSDEKLDGNAYLGLTALMGLVGWVPTAYLLHVETAPPTGVVTLAQVGAWAEAATQYSWPLMWLWAALFVVFVAITVLRVERGAVYSIPNALWGIGMAIALAFNAVGVENTVAWMVWLPWFVLFAVGYLVTGLLVARGWIYLLAGTVSAALAAYCVYGVFTSTGWVVVTQTPAVETPLAGAVLFPVPYTYVVIGLLHVVPVGVDALMGGRQMTEAGIPKVEADRQDEESGLGGVVPE